VGGREDRAPGQQHVRTACASTFASSRLSLTQPPAQGVDRRRVGIGRFCIPYIAAPSALRHSFGWHLSKVTNVKTALFPTPAALSADQLRSRAPCHWLADSPGRYRPSRAFARLRGLQSRKGSIMTDLFIHAAPVVEIESAVDGKPLAHVGATTSSSCDATASRSRRSPRAPCARQPVRMRNTCCAAPSRCCGTFGLRASAMQVDPASNLVLLETPLGRLRSQLRTFWIDADPRAARRLGQLMVEFQDERRTPEHRWPRHSSGRMLAPSEIMAKRRGRS
jgi:hypothetical protein